MDTVQTLDKLFQLIQKLTRIEKRNYSIYAQQNTRQADKPQHLIVFEAINKNRLSYYPLFKNIIKELRGLIEYLMEGNTTKIKKKYYKFARD